jgi:oxygen-independent coproporphyrinogen-3 oxidase
MSITTLNSAILSEWIGVEAPRYTSYPTAPNFRDIISEETYIEWIRNSAQGQDISLYIHIPFCHELCLFCGCNTSITKKYHPVASYKELLLKEIELFKSKVNIEAKIVHLHFGGGSPTILSNDDFKELFAAIKTVLPFTTDAKIAIEIDPRALDEEKALMYKDLSFNRVSLGVQDFDHGVQVAINRVQPFELVKKACELLRTNGISDINVDLIYGLPLQTPKTVNKTVELSLLLKPSRIAFFSYAHVTWKKKQQRLIEEHMLPSSDAKIEMYLESKHAFEQAGYIAVGIDHFALPDDEMAIALSNRALKRNFQGYTVDKGISLIGLGQSSISQLSTGYVQNTPHSTQYEEMVNGDRLPIGRAVKMTDDDILRKYIIDSIMCYMEVDFIEVSSKFNIDVNTYFAQELSSLKPFIDQDIISLSRNELKLTTELRMLARRIAAVFDQYFVQQVNQYSKVS